MSDKGITNCVWIPFCEESEPKDGNAIVAIWTEEKETYDLIYWRWEDYAMGTTSEQEATACYGPTAEILYYLPITSPVMPFLPPTVESMMAANIEAEGLIDLGHHEEARKVLVNALKGVPRE